MQESKRINIEGVNAKGSHILIELSHWKETSKKNECIIVYAIGQTETGRERTISFEANRDKVKNSFEWQMSKNQHFWKILRGRDRGGIEHTVFAHSLRWTMECGAESVRVYADEAKAVENFNKLGANVEPLRDTREGVPPYLPNLYVCYFNRKSLGNLEIFLLQGEKMPEVSFTPIDVALEEIVKNIRRE